MLLVTGAGEEQQVLDIFERWDLDAVVVGRVTDDGRMRVRWHGQTVVDIPVDPVAANAPMYDREQSVPAELAARQKLDLASIEPESDPQAALEALLDSPNLGSKTWVWYGTSSRMVRSVPTKPRSCNYLSSLIMSHIIAALLGA